MTNAYITILGTGDALATRCYNTCFTLHAPSGEVLLVDAGGGNGILTQLERAEIDLRTIHHLFLTHTHTDHLLGAVWVARMALQFGYPLHVWSHHKALSLLEDICRRMLPQKEAEGLGSLVVLHELTDGEMFEVGDLRLQCFDIHSSKEQQFGFVATLPDCKRLCCLGDEPYNPLCQPYAEDANVLLSEAFCLYEDREHFLPYEKHHSTALDAAHTAESLHARTLILYHTEDRTLVTRRARYTAEAKSVFSGTVIVPDDLERIAL